MDCSIFTKLFQHICRNDISDNVTRSDLKKKGLVKTLEETCVTQSSWSVPRTCVFMIYQQSVWKRFLFVKNMAVCGWGGVRSSCYYMGIVKPCDTLEVWCFAQSLWNLHRTFFQMIYLHSLKMALVLLNTWPPLGRAVFLCGYSETRRWGSCSRL